MDELNTEKNTKKTIKTIKSTKSTKNNKISIEDDIDDLADKYNDMEISKKAKEKQLSSINELTKNDIIIINNAEIDIKKYEKIINFLKIYTSREFENMELEKNDNQGLSYVNLNIGDIGEMITTMFFNKSKKYPSKGGCAPDNYEIINNKIIKREIKTISLDGTKECKNNKCKTKNTYFSLKCINCDSSEFKFNSDSRANINSDTIINNNQLIINVIKYNKINNSFNFVMWNFDINNEYFKKYCENQKKNGKTKSCNFIPYSYDWFLSAPMKIFECELFIDKIILNYLNIDNKIIERIPVSIFSKEEINYLEINTQHSFIKYDDYKNKFVLRKKNLGKERGIVKEKNLI